MFLVLLGCRGEATVLMKLTGDRLGICMFLAGLLNIENSLINI